MNKRVFVMIILPHQNIAKQLDDGLSSKREVVTRRKKIDKLWLFVENSIVHSLSAPHKRGILKLSENCAHSKPSFTKRSQGAKKCCDHFLRYVR